MSTLTQLQQPINEQTGFVTSKCQKLIVKSCQASLKAINTDLINVEKKIEHLIQQDEQLKLLFTLMTSIPGVGNATAIEEMVTAGRPVPLYFLLISARPSRSDSCTIEYRSSALNVRRCLLMIPKLNGLNCFYNFVQPFRGPRHDIAVKNRDMSVHGSYLTHVLLLTPLI